MFPGANLVPYISFYAQLRACVSGGPTNADVTRSDGAQHRIHDGAGSLVQKQTTVPFFCTLPQLNMLPFVFNPTAKGTIEITNSLGRETVHFCFSPSVPFPQHKLHPIHRQAMGCKNQRLTSVWPFLGKIGVNYRIG
ncbi:unnamed protein product [Protopolystoma xenopodis]|uniref:Uncharacterized protein n=1 Tax=Protopolystoma xenopodis TaxID=117903 RepID=A0A448WQI5_9PLAT|nr:unnamed protein product [Protopolystoma xenopodis]